MKSIGIGIALLLAVLLTACSTYYQKNLVVMDAVYKGNYQNASNLLDNSKLKKQTRNQLLYFLQKGTILFMNNEHAESNKYFQQADYFIEDYQKNYLTKAATFITNPSIQTYEGESFEKVLLHYYTTLNYLKQNKLDEALVECKRMELKLQKITDYYKGENKYKNDAFVYLLTGIVYDAQRNYNSAFIAYRNAYNIYKEVYAKNLETPAPLQLKHDLIRTALLTGFTAEAEQYKQEFNLTSYQLDSNYKNNAVIFWNNGFGPIKDQWSINFTVLPAGNGYVNFVNLDLGLNFPYYAGNDSKSMVNLKMIRVAFPKYVSRKPTITDAKISVDSLGVSVDLNMAEHVDKIAYVSLKDRMVKEVAEALVRLAVKQIAEEVANTKNEALGSTLSVLNAITEQADTRNWQTLPYSINYGRLQLPEGTYSAQFKSNNGTAPFMLDIKSNQTTFKIIQSPYFDGYSDQVGSF